MKIIKEVENQINEIAQQITDAQLKENEYCILILSQFDRYEPVEIEFIYKSLNDFKEKYPNDFDKIDKRSGIIIKWQTYD